MHKLLLVDDSPTLRGIMMRTLLQADLPIDEVFEAGSGAAGLTQLELHPDIRLVLCDVDMPGMDAAEFVRAVVREQAAERPFLVVVTTESQRATAQAALNAGAEACLEKPFTPDGVRAILAPYLSDPASAAPASSARS
jgi:two-component system, chemotaxis family, chemotaxis protein CheY